MAQADYSIADQAGASFRSEVNDHLAAIVSQNSGATEPTDKFAYQWWADTTSGILKQRNAANSAWINILTLSTGKAVSSASSDSATNIAGGSAGQTPIQSASGATSFYTGQLAGFINLLINGSFEWNQRQVATATDDTYAHDRWHALTQTAGISIGTLSNVADGVPFMARLTQVQATAQRMGYAQVIKGANCRHLRGQQVTFRFDKVRLSSSDNLRYAVLEWTGTENSVLYTDVVLSWTNTTYTGGNFFRSDTAPAGVTSQALTANTLTTGSSLTVTLGSSFTNLIVFVWTENAVAQNVTLDLGLAQLERGSIATPFEYRNSDQELALCEAYYWKNYNYATAPGATGAIATTRIRSYSGSYGAATVQFPVRMVKTPTCVVYNPSSGATGSVRDVDNSADRAASISVATEQAVTVESSALTALTTNTFLITASAELDV